MTPDARLVFLSRSFISLFPQADKAIGSKIIDLGWIPIDQRRQMLKDIQKCLRRKVEMVTTHQCELPDGRLMWIRWRNIPQIRGGKVVAFECVGQLMVEGRKIEPGETT